MKKTNILSCEKNIYYKILKIDCDEKMKKRLTEVGVIENQKIKILAESFGKKSLLIEVMGIRIAIDKNVGEKIIISYE